MADVDEADVEIELVPVLPDAMNEEIDRARKAVRALEEQQQTAASLSRQAVKHLVDAGLTGADTTAVLGVSPQRVSQLLRS